MMTKNAPGATFRAAEAADIGFLQWMNHIAAWHPFGPESPSLGEGLAQPKVARYLRTWKAPHDAGVIVEQDGTPVGAAWYTHFGPGDCLDALDDTSVPILSIAIEEAWRGCGLGRALMQQLIDTARRHGHNRLDLTTSPANSVGLSLYPSLGFVQIPSPERLQRMTLGL